jgi:hypothetical protein
MKKTFSFFLLVLALFFSCQNETRWYPSADVEVAGYYEAADVSGTRGIQITLIIHNIGDTSITSGAVTVKIATDKHEYLQTVASNAKIIPGGKIVIHVAVTYFEASEQVNANGITIYDSFFD